MPTDLPVSLATIQAFAFVLARISGAIVLVPLPGLNAAPAPVRVILSLSFTIALFPAWPVVQGMTTLGAFVGAMLAESAYGLALGLTVAFILEVFVLAAQMLSVQAGYSYASTIDPTTQADSTVLLVIAQLTGGLLFFALGLDRRILTAFAVSLQTHPPGSLLFTSAMGYDLIQLGSALFSTAFKMALPLLALLLMLDLSLGLMGRLNAQLQLVTLAFPVKTLAVISLFAWSILLFPRTSANYIEVAFALTRKFAGAP